MFSHTQQVKTLAWASPSSVIIITSTYCTPVIICCLNSLFNVDSDTVPNTTLIHTVPPEPELTEPLVLTPGMELEGEEWLKIIGGPWVCHQEEKHGVSIDVWPSHPHCLTRWHSKPTGGANSWNPFQKWWKHHHQEEEHALSSEEGMLYIVSTSMPY